MLILRGAVFSGPMSSTVVQTNFPNSPVKKFESYPS